MKPTPKVFLLLVFLFSAFAFLKAQNTYLNIHSPQTYFTSQNNCVSMRAETNIGDIVMWQWTFEPGDTTVFTTASQPFTACFPDSICYTVTLIVTTSNNHKDTATREFCSVADFVLYIPNAFIPNGDGINDLFLPVGEYCATSSWMKIYSRWGTLIFTTEADGILTKGWDGKFAAGTLVPEGPYLYEMGFTDCDGYEHFYRDVVLLLK